MQQIFFIFFLIFFFSFCLNDSFAQNSVMDFYDAKAKQMSTANIGGSVFKLNITKKDVKNGFLAYDYTPAIGYMVGVLKSPEEMAYFTSKNGQKFVVVASFSCMSEIPCYAHPLKFYTLSNGILIDVSNNYLTFETEKQISEAILDKQGGLQFKLGTAVKLSPWVKLPQIGTTIQVGLQEFGDEKFKFHLACELIYNENKGTFSVIKK